MSKDNELNNDYLVNQNITETTIQELFESNTKLDKKVSSIIENKNQWRQRTVSVRSSNWKLEMSLVDLQKKSNVLSLAVAKASTQVQTNRDMLLKYKIQDCHHLEDFRKDFDDEVVHFKNLFSGAQKEYLSENLDKDVEKYKAASLFINEKIEKIDDEIKEMNNKQGLSEYKLNDDPEILININNTLQTLFDDEAALSRIIKFDDNTCSELKRQINQMQRDIQLESKKK